MPGQDLQPVGDEHQHEDGDAERHHLAVAGTEAALDLIAHPPDDDLPGQLQLPGYARRGPAAQVEPHPEDDGHGDGGGPDGVEVEGDPKTLRVT